MMKLMMMTKTKTVIDKSSPTHCSYIDANAVDIYRIKFDNVFARHEQTNACEKTVRLLLSPIKIKVNHLSSIKLYFYETKQNNKISLWFEFASVIIVCCCFCCFFYASMLYSRSLISFSLSLGLVLSHCHSICTSRCAAFSTVLGFYHFIIVVHVLFSCPLAPLTLVLMM